MSRLTALRRKCPDKIRLRIAKAQRSQFFILQEVGPTAFVLRDNDQDAPAAGRKPSSQQLQAAAAAAVVADAHEASGSAAAAERTRGSIDNASEADDYEADAFETFNDGIDGVGGVGRASVGGDLYDGHAGQDDDDAVPRLSLQLPEPQPPPSTTAATAKKVKVGLGSRQTCTCAKHLSDGDLCVHILWVMLKVFHVDPESELIYQTSLIEREVDEVLRRRRIFQPQVSGSVHASHAGHTNHDHDQPHEHEDNSGKQDGSPGSQTEMAPRPIEPHDVCAICQEELLSDPPSPLAHCRFSCGNSIHVKCMKVLMEHQTKALGMDTMKCPLCRNNFGEIEELKRVFCSPEGLAKQQRRLGKQNGSDGKAGGRSGQDQAHGHRNSQPKPFVHIGFKCEECHTSPITGPLHRCTICRDLHLCDRCFKGGAHSEHAFMYKTTRNNKARQSERVVPTLLPPNLAASLETRELTDADYDMLLSLDKPQTQGSIPLHIVNGFPLIKIKGPKDKEMVRLDAESQCGVCMVRIGYGEIVRQIPCGHGFHQACIDRWLLHQRTVCPTCGLAAYMNLSSADDGHERGTNAVGVGNDDDDDGGREGGEKPDLGASIYRSATFDMAYSNQRARQQRRAKKKQPSQDANDNSSAPHGSLGDVGIMVVGSGTAGVLAATSTAGIGRGPTPSALRAPAAPPASTKTRGSVSAQGQGEPQLDLLNIMGTTAFSAPRAPKPQMQSTIMPARKGRIHLATKPPVAAKATPNSAAQHDSGVSNPYLTLPPIHGRHLVSRTDSTSQAPQAGVSQVGALHAAQAAEPHSLKPRLGDAYQDYPPFSQSRQGHSTPAKRSVHSKPSSTAGRSSFGPPPATNPRTADYSDNGKAGHRPIEDNARLQGRSSIAGPDLVLESSPLRLRSK
ncbi:hypothetical protein BC831DRAFT_452349 [Entophlyctis helioformis]|nr:hypothetical protein BC831DRAFT_452349 [Entophlyctis helioformis]